MVSIIIPVYNGAVFLKDTIQSCINQSMGDIEIILVNDCSKDGSEKIIHEYQALDSRIRYFENASNSGMCASANRGIDAAKGEYILVLGQDDLLEQNHVEKSLEYFVNDQVVATYCNYSLIDENSVEYKNVKNCTNETLDYHDFMYYNPLHSCGLLIKADTLKQVGGYPVFREYPQYGEWYVWIKLMECGQIVFAEGLNPKYRRHKDNLTNAFIDLKQSERLNAYWDECRLMFLHSELLNGLEKTQLFIFIYWGKAKRTVKRYLLRIPAARLIVKRKSNAHWF